MRSRAAWTGGAAALLLSLAACGSGPDKDTEGANANTKAASNDAAQNEAVPVAAAAPASREPPAEASEAAEARPTAAKSEARQARSDAAPQAGTVSARRCGWLHNPTPGNWWLFDGHGEWILAMQGGYRAEGMDEIPDMARYGWQKTNGHYGYGCACMVVTSVPGRLEVSRISKVQPLPLNRCRADKALPRP